MSFEQWRRCRTDEDRIETCLKRALEVSKGRSPALWPGLHEECDGEPWIADMQPQRQHGRDSIPPAGVSSSRISIKLFT